MARSRRSASGRPSRNWGLISGVTIATNPSGVTISKNIIDMSRGQISGATVSTKPSGVTIHNATVQSTLGYMLGHDTNAEKSVAGILSCAGTSLARQTLGLTLINHVMAIPCFNRAAVSACAIVVVKPSTSAWASGVTHVDFYAFATPQGGAFGTAVSIAYWAVGT